jgi:sugar phosphate permease
MGVRCAFAIDAGGFGLAAVQEAWQPYVLWAIFGLTLPGLSTVAPVAAISSWFVQQRTRAIVTYTFGGAMAGLVLAPVMAVIADAFDWRTVWVVMGAVFLAIAPLAWTVIRRTPEDVGLLPDGGSAAAEEGVGDESQGYTRGHTQEGGDPQQGHGRAIGPAGSAEEDNDWTVREALRSRAFWLLTAGFTLTMLPASSIYIHMTSYVQNKGYSLEEGAAAVSIYGLAAVFGRLVWGIVVARLGLQRSLVAWAVLYGVSIFLYALPGAILAIYATTVLLGIAVAGSLQFRAQAFPDYFGRNIVGSLIGYSSGVATLAGAAAPLLVAFAFDRTGEYTGIFMVFGAACMAAGVGFVFSAPRRGAGTPPPAPSPLAERG